MDRKTAIVILNFNDYDNTNKYVKKINNFDVINKIIVVDNSIDKKEFEFENNEKINIIISEENGGYAKGNNLGLKYIEENYPEINYIVISNPDVIVEKESFENCIDFLERNSDYAIVAPRMYDINNNKHPLSGWQLRTLKGDAIDSSTLLTNKYKQSHIEIYPNNYLNSKEVVDVSCVAGSFFVVRKNVFKEIGYFDENTFLYYEEDIIGKKISETKYKIAVLNNCKFQHMEAVSVKRSMNYLKKYKLMQKSKRYYHKKYNKRPFYKIWLLDLATLLGCLEIRYNNTKVLKKIYSTFKKGIKKVVNINFVVNFIKVLLYIYTIITWPIYMIIKKLRKNKKILYFSIVTWKWIKQRPHFIPLEIAKYDNYKVDYRYQTLKDKFMENIKENVVKNNIEENKKMRIKPFKIYPGIPKYTVIDKICNIVKTSLWNYDTIIITQPNQIQFFILRIHKLRKTRIIYECMDNYETWEIDKNSYRIREAGLIYFANNIIVSAEGLKTRIKDLYKTEKEITIIRNAYDKILFEKENESNIKLKENSITYIGTIDDWFDFENICKFAQKYKENNIYLIGPFSKLLDNIKEEIEKKYDNILILGPIEHELVPQYIQASNVMIMPFKINDLIKCVDPVKLYEYLYLKKPVVSTYWEELKQFENMVYFYDESYEKFEEAIKNALKNGFKNFNNEEYKNVVLDANWENRVKKYIELI